MIGGGLQGSSYRDIAIPERIPEIHVAITAALCWWDERPADLEACVRGIAQVADRVVALDGAYAHFPGGTPSSNPAQAATIRRVAAECGLDCLVITPDRLWAGQLEKRTYLYRMAALASDWVLVVDADHVISADREAVRAEIAHSGADVIAAPYTVPSNPGAHYASRWHAQNDGVTFDHCLLFRAFPNLTVEQRHWWVSGVVDGRKRWIIHTDASGEGLPPAHLVSRYSVEHRFLFRSPARIKAIERFLADREQIVAQTGQEDAA